jgi:hypothetical protein
MGLFSFIETFFFISLGITFVLILLLVYHFKQRITSIEKRSDTMFEIINNIVKEMTTIKSQQLMAQRIPMNVYPSFVSQPSVINNKEEEPYSDDDETTQNDPCSDDESESEDESEDEEQLDELEVNEQDDVEEVETNALEPLEVTEEVVDQIKVINVDNLEKIDVPEVSVNETDVPESDNETPVSEILEEEHIEVQKLEDESLEESDDTPTPQDNSKEIYRKMNLSALKALVITKGLCSDPSKMKKPELLKMLEASE